MRSGAETDSGDDDDGRREARRQHAPDQRNEHRRAAAVVQRRGDMPGADRVVGASEVEVDLDLAVAGMRFVLGRGERREARVAALEAGLGGVQLVPAEVAGQERVRDALEREPEEGLDGERSDGVSSPSGRLTENQEKEARVAR